MIEKYIRKNVICNTEVINVIKAMKATNVAKMNKNQRHLFSYN